MKSKIFLGLLLLGSADNNVFAAQAVVATQEKQVPSLEELCLKKITHILTTEDSDLKEKNYFSDALLPESMLLPHNIKESLKEWVILSNKITVTAAALWAPKRYQINPCRFDNSPLELLKKDRSDLAHLVTQKRIPWNISIQDLIDAGGTQKLKAYNGSLESLSLTSTEGLQSIPGLSESTTINCEFNKLPIIKENTFNGLTALKWLIFRGNKIAKITPGAFKGLPALQELYLDSNSITTIEAGTFSELTTLKHLSLSSNKITTIVPGAFGRLSALQNLSFWNNKITIIKQGTFNSLTALQELDLGNNKITTIENGAFNGLTALTWLNLDNNPIKTIGQGSFNGLSEELRNKLSRKFNVKF